MMERGIQLGLAVIAIPAVLFGYLAISEAAVRWIGYRHQTMLRAWLWLAPAVVLLGVFLAYPMVTTLVLSVQDASSEQFVGLDNFLGMLTDPASRLAVRNSVLWLISLTAATVVLGLVIAVLTDGARYERLAKATLFMPMAISFVAAGVIWRFMYDYRPPGSPQVGTLNAIWTTLGAEPRTWLVESLTNNWALIIAAVWMFTGFSVVILSAGLKAIPTELLDAARVDGANEWQVFQRITIPLLAPTITVVATTMAIIALKAFDIVYVMTNGNFETEVIATQMYKELFSPRDFGAASAIAVVLLLAVLPIMAFNLRSYRRHEASR